MITWLARLADRAPVGTGELARRVDRVRSAAGSEDHFRAGNRHQFGDALAQRFGALIGVELEGLKGRQLAHLSRRRVAKLGAAIADVAIPQAGQRIEVCPAGGIDDR